MAQSVKERIAEDLRTARETGSLRTDRIRTIVKTAIAEALTELKEGSVEVRTVAKDAFTAVIEVLGEKAQMANEDVTASVEGVVDGISDTRRDAIAATQAKLQQLQAEVSEKEQQLETDIDGALTEIEATESTSYSPLKSLIQSAVDRVKNREELDTLRQQYARLKGQLAILDANLAARYGDRYDEVKHHLDDAKTWYSNAKAQAEASGTIPMQDKQVEIERKLGEAGGALARKERQVKQLLKELWHTAVK